MPKLVELLSVKLTLAAVKLLGSTGSEKTMGTAATAPGWLNGVTGPSNTIAGAINGSPVSVDFK